METIRNYLEQMFLSLTQSEEVKKAKEELYQMMEDKYLELKRQGKSENEAIGTVISEFGNIEELIEELGIQSRMEKKDTTFRAETKSNGKEKGYRLTIQEATQYLDDLKPYGVKLALATMFCIFSPIVLIFLASLSEHPKSGIGENMAAFTGIAALLLFIVIAVSIFIQTGFEMEKYNHLKNDILILDESTKIFLSEQREKEKNRFSIQITIGVALCIISILPILAMAFFFENSDLLASVGVCALLFIVGIAMWFIIPSEVIKDGYKKMLQEEEYKKSSKNMEAISTAYWCIVTAIYLGWSFWTFRWGITWIIWPVAGVLYGAIEAIYTAIRKNM